MTERALDSENLVTRADGNKRFGEADFDAWVQGILNDVSFESALDICCGTGNQLVLYAAQPGVTHLAGIDLSAESLARARARLDALAAAHALFEVAIEDAFAEPAVADRRFDLVSCFYGLYYARDPGQTLDHMIERLTDGGTALVVGPHGGNNAALFALLQRHFPLPPLVLSSATTFMDETVVPIMRQRLGLEIRTFVNRVRYPSATALLDYWRASTFFSAPHEGAVARDIETHFERHDAFVVEKHVMAAIGRKVES
jgi:SAM-dependent methyltransferase